MSQRGYLFVMCAAAAMLCAAGQLSAKSTYEWRDGQWVASAAPAEGTNEGELALIRELCDGGRYASAIDAAKAFGKHYPGDEKWEEVCLLAGQSEMRRGRYWQAYGWFEKQLNEFPSGRYSDRALEQEYQLADAFLNGAKRIVGILRLDATDEAIDILQRIATHAPGTEIATRSLLRIGDHHFTRGQWVEATEAYDSLLTLIPGSSEAPYAMRRSAEAAYYSFNGLAFDETPLIDAEQRFANFAQAHPAAAHKANVGQFLDQINETRAEKLLATAQFYERTHKKSAAAFYCKQVIERFPQTQSAADARGVLERMGGLAPAEPPTAELPGQPAADTDGEQPAPAANPPAAMPIESPADEADVDEIDAEQAAPAVEPPAPAPLEQPVDEIDAEQPAPAPLEPSAAEEPEREDPE